MTRRPVPPFRADHVGSLLRPPELTRTRADYAAGLINGDQLRQAEDAAIRQVIQLQRDAGLRTATDEELRRSSWHMDFLYQLDGVQQQPSAGATQAQFRNADGAAAFLPQKMHISSRIGLPETLFADAFTYLREHATTEQTPKLTIPSPSMLHYRGGDALDASVYPDLDQFWDDVVAAYTAQVRGVYELGCRYLQLDDTSLAHVNDPAQRAHIQQIGGDPWHLHERYIATLNRVLAAAPEDLVITTHLCRGNYRSSWASEGSYDFVAETLFGELNVSGYFLEFDDERSGTFAPLRHVPRGKQVVLGLVTSKRPELESKDELKRRIDEAAQYVDLEQLCLSPQCGFSSTEEGNELSIDQQRAKLELIVEVANEVWGD